MELFIIRHGQSTNNALADFSQRVCDPHLTDLGQRQAQIVAQHLAGGVHLEQTVGTFEEETASKAVTGYGITKLYCSAMRRALQTAQPIGQALGLAPEVWQDIHEVGGIHLEHADERGVVGYPGLTRAEILAEFPNVVLPDSVTEKGWWDVRNGREDWPTCQGRAIRVAKQLWAWAERDERIAIVSHAAFVDALIKALLNVLPGNGLMIYHFNTALTRFDFLEDKQLRLRYINRVDHLPPSLVS